jgi:hypothetical protein
LTVSPLLNHKIHIPCTPNSPKDLPISKPKTPFNPHFLFQNAIELRSSQLQTIIKLGKYGTKFELSKKRWNMAQKKRNREKKGRNRSRQIIPINGGEGSGWAQCILLIFPFCGRFFVVGF